MQLKKHFSHILIVVCLPFVLWAVCGILPTFDDYTSLQSPWWVQIADPGYFFPDAVRRPFDFLFGCLLGRFPDLFPVLNHVVIILGHTANALLVFSICHRLQFGVMATNIATLFFFFSPATLGVTLACDGLNQTFAQSWGLMALWAYLSHHSFPKHLWLVCVAMAALSKENGLAWAVVPPVLAFAFGLTSLRQTARDIGKGLLLAVAYFVVLTLLIHSGIAPIDYPDEYVQTTPLSHLKDLVQVLAYTWVPLDYMSAVYPPTRNLTIVAVTVLMALPFLLFLASRWRMLLTRRLLLLLACFFILVSPHLLTVVSIMHNYAALSMAAVIVACLLSQPSPLCSRGFVISVFLFMAAAIFTDMHHHQAARQSGLLGKSLAMQAISTAEKPLERVFCINIDDEAEPRYSNFCVRPVDAFAWGLSVRHYSHYSWKTDIAETTLTHYDPQVVDALAKNALEAGYEAVWVVGHRSDSLTIYNRQITQTLHQQQ